MGDGMEIGQKEDDLEAAWLLEPALPSERGCCTASGFRETGSRDTHAWLCSEWIPIRSGLSTC